MNDAAANKQYVLIGPSSFGERDKTPLRIIEEAGLGIIENPYKRKLERTELLELLKPNVVGILAGLEPIDAEVLRNSGLRVVSRVGSGIANVDVDAARSLGVPVHFTPSGPTEAVAELTLGALLSLMRLIAEMDAEMRAGRWSKRIGVQLHGKTVVIVGYGRIGRRVAELLAPFQVRIVVVDPLASPEALKGVEAMTLSDALPVADVLTLHCSGEKLLLGESELATMKRGAFILNAARGTLIDEGALIRALDEGRLAGAWLDTFGKEPYGGPLTGSRKVLLTPHVGSYTEECRLQMETEAAENLLRGLAESTR